MNQRGFTFFELVVTLAISSIALLGLSKLLGNSQSLMADVNNESRIRTLERRNMRALSNILRGAPVASLTGFDGEGMSTKLSFSRSYDVKDGEYIATAPVELVWRRDADANVDGVESPGHVFLVDGDGNASLVAENVPANGFSLELDGNRLLIRLTTFYEDTRPDSLQMRTATSVVALRN